jgi:DNA-3-methyladenine glycosylase II
MTRLIRSEHDLRRHIGELSRAHPIFEPIRAAAGQVPLRWLDGGFKGLVWTITGQQISVAAGRAIFARLEAAIGTFSAESIAAVSDEKLRAAGLSAPKIRTLRALQEAALGGLLDLEGLHEAAPEAAISSLCRIKGIGPWTAEVYLLFAAGHADIFPAADLALQEAARLAFDLKSRPTAKELRSMSEMWTPWRSAAARLLWAFYGVRRKGQPVAPV